MPNSTSSSPQRLRSLVSVVERLSDWGDSVAICAMTEGGHEDHLYSEIAVLVPRLAAGLVERGLKVDDCVAIYAPNCFEWFVAGLAVVSAGGVIVPIDVQVSQEGLQHVIDDSGAQLAFTSEALNKNLREVGLTKTYLFDTEDATQDWKRLIGDSDTRLPNVSPDDRAILFYTSGTTGVPKGVPLTHAKLVHSLNALFDLEIVKSGDRLLVPLPLHHVYPVVMGVLYSLFLGLKVILPQELTGPAVARALKEGDATALIGVPRLYRAIVSGIMARATGQGGIKKILFKTLYGISYWARKVLGIRLGKILLRPLHEQLGPNLNILASGGSKLDAELALSLEALGWRVAIGYGLTETAPLLTNTLPGDGHYDTVGSPVPGVEIRIDKTLVGSFDEETGQVEQGEIVAKGPNIFDGYHGLPEATAQAFTEDGWFRTGDLGYFDDKGLLHVLGRASSTIVTAGGENIQPEDIEAVYQQHPLIEEIGVLQHEEQLVALIVPSPIELQRIGDADPEWNVRKALALQARELASYQCITDFALTRKTLPRTRLGKLRRHLLLQPYLDAKSGEALSGKPATFEELSDEDRNRLEDPAVLRVWEWLCQRYSDKDLTPDTSPQLELGIDSLEWLNVTLEIRERAGIELTQDVYGHIETVRHLLDAVAEASVAGDSVSTLPFDNPQEQLSPMQLAWFKPLGTFSSAARWLLDKVNWLAMKFMFKLKIEGIENLPDEGQYIICPNHLSYIDPMAVTAALPRRHLDRLYWSGWQGVVARNPINSYVARLGHTVPIDPLKGALSSLAVGAAILDANRILGWFPEGRRSPGGNLQTFKPGIGLLAEHFNVPIVPMFVSGSFEALPTSRTFPRCHPVTLYIGKPVTPKELANEGEGDTAAERITSGLRKRIAALAPEAH